MGTPARRPPPASYADLQRLPSHVVGELLGGELHLGSDVIVPDLASWRREQLPSLPDEAFLTLAPRWVCEITSPWVRVGSWTGRAPAHLEPFDAVELDLDAIWG